MVGVALEGTAGGESSAVFGKLSPCHGVQDEAGTHIASVHCPESRAGSCFPHCCDQPSPAVHPFHLLECPSGLRGHF